MSYLVAALLSLGLVAANAFFVASEFAMVKMRLSRLEQLAAKGNKKAQAALKISHKLDAYLSANQLGITLASLALGWIGEPAFAGLLEPWLAGLGSWSIATAHTIAVLVSLAIITFLHTVLGELAPKSLAIERTEPLALWTATPLRLFYFVMFPVIWILNAASRLVLRLLGLHRPPGAEILPSEELRFMLQRIGMEPGTRRVIDRLFDYTHRVARQVMTLPRDVVVLDAAHSWEENLAVALSNEYTRYPLIDSTLDRVLGYVHLKDIVRLLGAKQKPSSIRELAREPIYASPDAPIEQLRRDFLSKHIHLAIILDGAQPFAGIVTLEDLLEEFVGEIRDEQDTNEIPPIVHKQGGGFEVDGRLTLDVAAREIGIMIPATLPHIETLGEYIAHELGPSPAPQASVVRAGFRLTILEERDGLVQRIRVEPIPNQERR